MYRFALQNLISRPVRSSLAMIGMTVAIMGMVGLFSIANGLDRAVSDTLSRVPGLVAMQRGAPIPLFSTLPKSWTEELESIPGVRGVSPECWARANVIDGEMVVSPPRLLAGCDIVRRNRLHTGVFRDDMVEGRFLEDQDLGTRNCVISRPIAEEFGKSIGDSMEVNGEYLTVVGIYYTGSLLLDVVILIDDSVFREIVRFDPETVSSFYIEQTGEVSDEELLARINEKFRGRGPDAWSGSLLMNMSGKNPIDALLDSIDRMIRGSSPGKKSSGSSKQSNPGETPENQQNRVADNPMEVRLATDWAGRIDKFAEDLDIALFLLTSLGMLIAVVSIVNTMLMSVTERMSEFGILRANGWSQFDLIRLIGWESLLLGLAGGILGTIIGWGLTLAVNASFPAKFELYASPQLLIKSLIFSALLGMFSGLYPAIWAARMRPMDAIRRN